MRIFLNTTDINNPKIEFFRDAILIKEDLEDGKQWSLYEDTKNRNLICWTKTKKDAIQYAKDNNITIKK